MTRTRRFHENSRSQAMRRRRKSFIWCLLLDCSLILLIFSLTNNAHASKVPMPHRTATTSSTAVPSSIQQQQLLSRRQSLEKGLATAASAALTMGVSAGPASADPYNALIPMGSGGMILQAYRESNQEGWDEIKNQNLKTTLAKSRIGSTSLSPIGAAMLPGSPQELYYAPFLFGSWKVQSTLQQKIFPFGKDFVPSISLLDGSPRNRNEKVGDTTTFEWHAFSTLADTAANQLTVNLGLGVPQPKIIADRAYNIQSINKAYNQQSLIDKVDWDYRKDPTRLTMLYASGPIKKSEVFVTARQSETFSQDPNIFSTIERTRSVTLGVGSVVASDQESMVEYQAVDPNTVRAYARLAVYLTPNPNSREGVLWQQVQGRAVALYDYEWTMTRILEDFTTRTGDQSVVSSRACVTTPKDVVQCE